MLPSPVFSLLLLFSLALAMPVRAADEGAARSRRDRERSVSASPSPGVRDAGAPGEIRFAPVPSDHPLAGMWNDPDFARRLAGSYGFLSEAEPRLSAEEQILFRDRIMPLIRDEPARAIPELQAALKPGASAVFDFTLGTVYFQNEDFTNAVVHYEAALAKFPDYRRAQRNLALALSRSGRFDEAIPHLARTVELGGADARTYGLLGFAHLSRERYVSAEAAYRLAALFAPDNLDFQLGLVKCHIALGNLQAASALLDELIQRHPERDQLWSLQANVFVQQERLENAVVSLQILRKLGLATSAQLALLGDLHFRLENRDLALEAYLAAIEKDGGKSPARSLRAAEIFLSRGAPADARLLAEKLRTAGALSPEDELRLAKVEARIAFAEGRAEEAMKLIESVTRRNPLDGDCLLLAGDHFARSGEPEKAAFRYDAAARIEGFEADALLKLAQLKVTQQKYTEAVELLRRAQKLKPRDNVARYLEKVELAAGRARS